MRQKGKFKLVSPKKINERVKKDLEYHSRDVTVWSNILKSQKTQPNIVAIKEILKNFKSSPEIRLSLIDSYNKIISSRKKEWPDLYNKWNLFLTLESIHKKNK